MVHLLTKTFQKNIIDRECISTCVSPGDGPPLLPDLWPRENIRGGRMDITRFVLIVCALLLLAAPVAAGKQANICPFPANSQGSSGSQANLCPLPGTSSTGIASRYLCDPSFGKTPALPSSSVTGGGLSNPCILPGTNQVGSPSTTGIIPSGVTPSTTQTQLNPPCSPASDQQGSSLTGAGPVNQADDTGAPFDGNQDEGPVSLFAADPLGQNLEGGVSVIDDMGTLPVEQTGPMALPGFSNPPTDPDGDGLYEDLNGNGRIDFGDVNVFYANIDWIIANEPTRLFDMNGNGVVEESDISAAFGKI